MEARGEGVPLSVPLRRLGAKAVPICLLDVQFVYKRGDGAQQKCFSVPLRGLGAKILQVVY